MNRMAGSIKTLFIVSIIVLTGALLTVLTVLNVWEFSDSMEAQVKETLEGKAGTIAGQLDQRLVQVTQKTVGLASAISNLKTYDTDVMYGVMDSYIQSDEMVYGSGLWFAENAYQAGQKYFGPYRYRKGDAIEFTMEYSDDKYNYFNQEYYKGSIANPGKVAFQGNVIKLRPNHTNRPSPHFWRGLFLLSIYSGHLTKKEDFDLPL